MKSLLGLLVLTGLSCTCHCAVGESESISKGRELAHSYDKGNCLACHRIPGDSTAITLATLGPPLANLKERFPERAKLRAQIWDSTVNNPNTIMPPFGKNGVLTEQEIDQIVEYISQY
jgi:L-cysteine S-thiosulfotransferase